MAARPPISTVRVIILALVLASAFTAFGWLQAGSPFTVDPIRSTDDMVRIVTVREWLAGQAWYDAVLHRLGPPSGTLMHWSRLVDAPIGALVVLGNALGLDGERLAMVVWPFLTFVATAAAMLVTIRRAAAGIAPVPAFVIGGFALFASGVFNSGFVDHHNVQLVLVFWLVAMLIPGGSNPVRDLAMAGILSSLMLAIGMEGLPFAIAGALVVFFRLLGEREAFFASARAYGLAMAIAHGLLFVALVAPNGYGASHCDSFSLFHLVNAAVGGLVLWAGLSHRLSSRLWMPQLTVPVMAALVVIMTTLVWFPHCLADPLIALDEKLHRFWLDSVFETQGAMQIARLDPWLLPYLFVLPLLAILFGTRDLLRNSLRSPLLAQLVFVVIATAVTLFQMRGTQFATPLAALLLCVLVTRLFLTNGEGKPALRIAALALSCTLVWKILIQGAMALFPANQPGPLMADKPASAQAGCSAPETLAALALEPAGTVAAANSLGPAILYYTAQRALSGPYHRNVTGNLAWINAMTGTPEAARKLFAQNSVTLLALCPSDPDEKDFLAAAPDGFTAQLIEGQFPAWLEPVAATQSEPLKLFRVKP